MNDVYRVCVGDQFFVKIRLWTRFLLECGTCCGQLNHDTREFDRILLFCSKSQNLGLESTTSRFQVICSHLVGALGVLTFIFNTCLRFYGDFLLCSLAFSTFPRFSDRNFKKYVCTVSTYIYRPQIPPIPPWELQNQVFVKICQKILSVFHFNFQVFLIGKRCCSM